MSRFVDIHAHLLPGIDDGPDNLEGALEMAHAAVQSGTETLAATPHVRPDLFPGVHIEELAERGERLREELVRNQIPLRIVGGAEVSLLWALDADDEALRLVTYNQGGTDVLIETPSDAVMIDQLLGPLLQRGMRVVLAHRSAAASCNAIPSGSRAYAIAGWFCRSTPKPSWRRVAAGPVRVRSTCVPKAWRT